jgi:ABC-2 type transport system permease protein
MKILNIEDLKKHFITTFLIGALLLGGIVVLINMISNNINLGRFDLTADQVYKLSPSVEKVLSKLEAPIEITYYVSSSEKMPTRWKHLERDVIDKLEEVKLASRGKLSYTVFDPSAEEEKEAYKEEQEKDDQDPFSKDNKPTRKKIAQKLYEKGVIPFGVQSTERDEFAIKRVYSSIVLSYLDRKEDVIEEVRPETFGNLEYEIMSRIYKLISNKRPKIGFYPAEPEMDPKQQQYYQQGPPPDMYGHTVQLLKESGYDVTRTNIKEDDPIPKEIQTMLIMVDQPLNERQMYEIDKLIHDGIRIIMANQSHNYQVIPTQPGEFDLRGMPTRSNINSLIKTYGIEFDTEMFMDRNSAYIQVPVYSTRSMGIFQVREQRFEPVTKPVMIRINPQNINNRLSISNKITDLFYMYGSRLIVHDDILEENQIQSKTLFTSSDFSWTRSGRGYGPVNTSMPLAEDVLRHQTLGVLLEGKFKSKYADQTIPSWQDKGEDEKEEEQPSEITDEAKENKLIAIGCSNLFKDDLMKAVMSHKALLLNCVDALTLGDELINIRSKNIVSRQIRDTSGMGKAMAKAFVIWFPPIVFVALGFYINIRRKRKS